MPVEAFYAVLDRYTLADLVADRAQMRAILLHLPRGVERRQPSVRHR
jgi:hypothetical protein